MSDVRLKVNITPLKKLVDLFSTGGQELTRVFKQWGVIYSAYVRRRFVENSRGGGGWPDLAESTKRGRARRKAASKQVKREGGKLVIMQPTGRKFAILRNTGVLYNALSPGVSGNLTEIKRDGVVFGFQDQPHGGDKATIRDIATWHDLGMGRNPKREILVAPDAATKERLLARLGNGFKMAAKRLEFRK